MFTGGYLPGRHIERYTGREAYPPWCTGRRHTHHSVQGGITQPVHTQGGITSLVHTQGGMLAIVHTGRHAGHSTQGGIYHRVYLPQGVPKVYHRVYLQVYLREEEKPLREEASRLPMEEERNLCAKRSLASLRNEENPLRKEVSRLLRNGRETSARRGLSPP